MKTFIFVHMVVNVQWVIYYAFVQCVLAHCDAVAVCSVEGVFCMSEGWQKRAEKAARRSSGTYVEPLKCDIPDR